MRASPRTVGLRARSDRTPGGVDMTTEQVRAPGPPQAATGRYLCTPGEDLVTALLGACLVGGALTDAWVHTNRASTLESFFTPWHALLYGGFAAIAAWTFWLALRRRASTPRWWRDGWPVGYGIGAVGVIGFMAGGLF